ncbi:hypothetical protein DFH06DRAFT_1151987 [Mycena polygramma]|nr:hypothetical protein DFH06DRAFT_1151987 [Mycena polygramma]
MYLTGRLRWAANHRTFEYSRLTRGTTILERAAHFGRSVEGDRRRAQETNQNPDELEDTGGETWAGKTPKFPHRGRTGGKLPPAENSPGGLTTFLAHSRTICAPLHREENDKGPIEIEAFLLSIWIAVRDAKRAYPEFPWKTTYPTLYSIVPPDRDRRAEIETFVPSLPDSDFELPKIPASLRYAQSSGDEAPPPAKKPRPNVNCPLPLLLLSVPNLDRLAEAPQLLPAALPPNARKFSISSPESEEGVPLANIHAGDQASEIEVYVRHAHHTGYVPERFDEASEIYPNIIEKPRGGIPAPPAAVEKVSSVIVHDATIVPEGHVTFYICTNCATRKQRCISRGLGKRCYSCNNGKMSCSLHSDIFQLLLAQERLRPMNNVGSISIVNVLQRVIAARRNADVHHYFLRNALLDFDDVVSDACILLEQQRQVLDFDDLVACFENPQDLQTVFTLFERLGIDYESSMDDLRARNPLPAVQGLSKDGDVVPGDAAEPETHFYVRGPTQQTAYGERDRFPPDSRKVEEHIHKVPAGYDIHAVGPPPDAVLEMRRQSKGKAPARPFVTPPAAQSSPQRAVVWTTRFIEQAWSLVSRSGVGGIGLLDKLSRSVAMNSSDFMSNGLLAFPFFWDSSRILYRPLGKGRRGRE